MAEPTVEIRKLLEAGYSPTTLASTLGLDPEVVYELASATRRAEIVADDEILADAVRKMAWRVIEESMRILEEGTLNHRMSLISRLSGPLFKLMNTTASDDLDALREDMDKLREAIRGEVRASGEEADDPVEAGRDDPAQPELGSD